MFRARLRSRRCWERGNVPFGVQVRSTDNTLTGSRAGSRKERDPFWFLAVGVVGALLFASLEHPTPRPTHFCQRYADGTFSQTQAALSGTGIGWGWSDQ
jgi:hypothetical protein